MNHGAAERLADLRVETQGAISKLELVAFFDDDDRRVPIHLGRDDAA